MSVVRSVVHCAACAMPAFPATERSSIWLARCSPGTRVNGKKAGCMDKALKSGPVGAGKCGMKSSMPVTRR